MYISDCHCDWCVIVETGCILFEVRTDAEEKVFTIHTDPVLCGVCIESQERVGYLAWLIVNTEYQRRRDIVC